MTISVASRKAKGRKFQQEIAKYISELLDIPVEKDGDIESRPMGQSGVDVILRGEAKKKFPYSVEIKRQEMWSIHNWIKQAKENQKDGTDWLLFCRKSRQDSVVVMDTKVFFKLYKKIIGDEKSGK